MQMSWCLKRCCPVKRFFFLLISVSLSFLSVFNPFTFQQTQAADIPSQILDLKIEGDPSIVWFEKGKMLYRIMAWPDAVSAFSNIGTDTHQDLQNFSDIIDESSYLMANCLIKTGRFAEAMSSVEKIQGRSKFYVQSLYTRTIISLDTGNVKEAYGYLERLLKFIPDSKMAKGTDNPEMRRLAHKTHLLLGFISLSQNNPEDAARHFDLIPEDSPLYARSLFGAGWAYANLGRWVRAVILWEELIYTSPDSRYSREVMPYIGYAYTTLSAYGKALEQNGNALRYYEDLLKKIQTVEKEIPHQDIKWLNHAIESTGDSDLTEKLSLYNGLASVEDDIKGIKVIISSDADTLINDSMNLRKEISDNITEKLKQDINELKQKLLEESARTSLEMARNLYLEGGGRINNDMIFNVP